MDPHTAGWIGLAAIGLLVVLGVRVAYAAAAVVLLVSASALVYANLRLLRRVNRYTVASR